MRLVRFRGKWNVVIGSGRSRRRLSLHTADRAEADRQLGALLKDQAEIKGGTVSEIVDAYLADRERIGKPTATAGFAWKATKPALGALMPSQITREICRSYVALRRQAGRRDGTIIRELGMVKAALRWHDRNTPAIFEMPAAPAARETHLTMAEFVRLRDAAAETPHLLLFLELAKATGARAGALLELTWTRVDFERRLVRLGPDVGSKRRATVPMGEVLLAALARGQEAALSPYVIEYAGERIHSIKTAFRRAAAAIGRPEIGPHTIRHSVAVWMAEDGTPMSEIAQFLGHTSTAITEKHYARYSPNYLRRAAAVLDF